ncbi:MAG: hypothetical protein QM287_00095, partial [Bacillota bacterium]|nr:hypothetical protein [Bacillota bacterium]
MQGKRVGPKGHDPFFMRRHGAASVMPEWRIIVSSNLIVNSAGILMQEDRFSDLIRNSESRLLIISFGLIVQVFLVIMTIVLEAFFVLLALRLSKYGTAKMGVLIHIVLMGSIVT